MNKWDERFLALAEHIATWSKDQSTQVGAVIVGPHREIRATGYNGFPRGVDDDVPERQARPTKYAFTEHAERNAIYFAALNGVTLEDCTLYVTMFPCADCARGIISAGLRRVVAPAPTCVRWAESHAAARVMLAEAGVEIVEACVDDSASTSQPQTQSPAIAQSPFFKCTKITTLDQLRVGDVFMLVSDLKSGEVTARTLAILPQIWDEKTDVWQWWTVEQEAPWHSINPRQVHVLYAQPGV